MPAWWRSSICNSSASLGYGDANLDQEAIKLRLGQRISAFEVDRVLRRKYGEPAGQWPAGSVTRNLAFFHALEQRGLRARRHAIDLVHEQQISKHRARVKCERVGTGTQDRGAEDVGGHQVGSGLHALEAKAEQASQRLDHQGFCDAWNTLEQRVPLA